MKAKVRNDWYRDSLLYVHIDNHSEPAGKGQDVDDLTALLGSIPADMVQVSAQSSGPATYPTEIGINNPELRGYDTLATFKEIAGRLGRKLCIYMSVDRRPELIERHPEWAQVDADGNRSDLMVCQRPNSRGEGYLYEGFLPQIREIIANYDPDGLWFDGDLVLARSCWCERCVSDWRAETGLEPPHAASSPHWLRWWNWDRERFNEYRRLVAECIHEASPKAIYTSNWSWFLHPEPSPDWLDNFSADAWMISDFQYGTMRWGAQQRVPWDIMSYTRADRAFVREHSLQRSLQEAALTIAAGGRWFIWGFASGQVPPHCVADSRHCAYFVRDREAALGATVSLAQVAVLDSETSWHRGGGSGLNCRVDRLARALQESHYLTDIVNEVTCLEHLTPYRVIIVPEHRYVASETLADLGKFVLDGGMLVLTGAALRGEGDEDAADVTSLLGLERAEPSDGCPARVSLGESEFVRTGVWDVKPDNAEVLARFADGRPALARNRVGQGAVVYLSTSDLRYPDDGFIARVFRMAGAGPSYSVHGAGEAPLVCSLRGRPGQVILHATDLSTRSNGELVELDSRGCTEPNPVLRDVEIRFCVPEATTSARAVPPGTPVETHYGDGVLTVRIAMLQTHAAVVLSTDAQPPFGLLPAETPLPEATPHVEDPRLGVLLCDDFENVEAGSPPGEPWVSQVGPGASVTVTDEAAAGGTQSLRLSAPGGLTVRPSVHARWRPFRKGTARLSCDMRVEAGVECQLAVRQDGRLPGPSLGVDGTGNLLLGNLPDEKKVLMAIPPDTWFNVAIEMRLAVQSAGYTLTVTVEGQEPQIFGDLPYGQWFATCESLHFVSSGQTAGSFHVDNVKFERLTLT